MQMLGMHQEERQANTQTKKKKKRCSSTTSAAISFMMGEWSCVTLRVAFAFFFVYVCVWYALLSCVVAGACTSAGLFSPCSSSSRISWKH